MRAQQSLSTRIQKTDSSKTALYAAHRGWTRAINGAAMGLSEDAALLECTAIRPVSEDAAEILLLVW